MCYRKKSEAAKLRFFGIRRLLLFFIFLNCLQELISHWDSLTRSELWSKLADGLQRDFAENANRDFINSLGKLLPAKLIPVIVRLSGIPAEKKVNQISKKERTELLHLLKNLTVTIKDFRSIDEAIVTGGGVDISEINPKTMESKKVSGLYFAGEVIDVDAYTGGFNLQIAFSTGYAAGVNMWKKSAAVRLYELYCGGAFFIWN